MELVNPGGRMGVNVGVAPIVAVPVSGVPHVSVGVLGHLFKMTQSNPFVRPFQASVRPLVKSSQPSVTM